MSPYCYMYPTCKISHTKKMHACKAAACGPHLEISYIPLLCVMTLHYHRVYKISSFEANLSLEDLKQLCRQTHPKTNN